MNNTGQMFNGYRIFTNDQLIIRKQIRFPRSKGKRIQKKWKKNERNFISFPDTDVRIMNGVMVMHPSVYSNFRAVLEGQKRKIDHSLGITDKQLGHIGGGQLGYVF